MQTGSGPSFFVRIHKLTTILLSLHTITRDLIGVITSTYETYL